MKHAYLFLLFVSAALTSEAQLIKTTLTLTVRDELGNTVEGATVTLYETEANYREEKNPVVRGETDKKGIIKFKDLQPISYYLIVTKGDKNNQGAAEQISKLEAKKINKVTVIIQ